MTQKAVISEHFSRTADVWRANIYKPRSAQGMFEYYDKQYRFDYVVGMIENTSVPGKRAMDMGCGAGQLLPVLVDRGYQAYGIDVALPMIEKANELCKKAGIAAEIRVGDCEKLDYPDNFFDLYIAMGVIEYMDDDAPMLKEIMRVLKPGGTAVVTVRSVLSWHVRWRSLYQRFIEDPLRNYINRALGKPASARKYISREHNPAVFCSQIESLGFKSTGGRYAHFHIFFSPFDRVLFPLEAVLGKTMEKYFSEGGFPFMASTYIAKFQKPQEKP